MRGGLLVALAFLVLYWRTLAPDVVGHDAGEFQFVPYVFGIPHYTGYPLYLVVGKVWSLLPIGSVAWRMNLLSAAFGAIAAALAYLCARQLTGSRGASVLAAVTVGVAPLEWLWSTVAGVRSLAVGFVALTLLLALRWEHAVRLGDAKTAEWRLLLLALIAGFGLDHHRTFALLLPFLAGYILLVRWQILREPRLLAKALGLVVLPLLLYGVLPLRAALGTPWDQWNTATWQGFVNVAIAGTDTAAHLTLTPAQALERSPSLGSALLGSFSPIVLALAILGLGWLALRRPALALMLASYTAVLLWLTVIWNIGGELNLVYIMPAYVPIALMAAAGVAALPRFRLSSVLEGVLALAVAAGGVYAGRGHLQPAPEALDDFRQDLFQGHQARRLANALAALPPDATVVADWDQATPIWYAQLVDGINPGVGISYPASTLPNVLARARGPVFLATATFRPPAGSVSAAGPYVEVLRQPRDSTPAGALPIDGAFGDEIELAAMAPLGQPEYGILPVTLYWKALRQPAADYHVSLRLMASADRVAVQRDEAAPVLGLSPTSSWAPGQVTADYYELDLREVPDGTYDLAVVLYQPLPNGEFRNLSYAGSDRAVLGRLVLSGGRISFATG